MTSSGTDAAGQKRIAVLGASGYTGEEVVRLLALHPSFKVTTLTGESQAGKVCNSEDRPIVTRRHNSERREFHRYCAG